MLCVGCGDNSHNNLIITDYNADLPDTFGPAYEISIDGQPVMQIASFNVDVIINDVGDRYSAAIKDSGDLLFHVEYDPSTNIVYKVNTNAKIPIENDSKGEWTNIENGVKVRYLDITQ